MNDTIDILEISKQTGVSTKKIKDILYLLNSSEFIENNELVKLVGVSRNAINLVKQKLSTLFSPSSNTTQLTTQGKNKIKEVFKDSKYQLDESLLQFFNGDEYNSNLEYLNKISGIRPEADRNYDQFTATIETTAKRAALLNFLEDIEGKRILFIGDDDLTSLAVARYKTAAEIVVLDVDNRILSAINNESNKQALGIKTEEYDARRELPKELRGKFDIVFTDPPYTSEGVQLFVARGIDALDKKNECARLYVCYGNSDRAKERFLPIYEVFSNAGLMIRWIFDKFNRYNGAESIGSTSSLFICEITPKTKSIPVKYDKIYTFN